MFVFLRAFLGETTELFSISRILQSANEGILIRTVLGLQSRTVTARKL